MKYVRSFLLCAAAAVLLSAALYASLRLCYRRPYPSIVKESGVDPALVYAVMKAESGFDENTVSRAGAVGLMQLLPSTAEFIVRREGLAEGDLLDGAYNTMIGCRYLSYLIGRFSDEHTAVCAYNAGEGTVRAWLRDPAYSSDGKTLQTIPYPETRAYEKKVFDFKKKYQILYQ